MFRNYVKMATRFLLKYKSNAFINIAGLAIGFAAFLLIFLVVRYEESFDDFHPGGRQIYRVVRIGHNPVNREYRTGVPIPVTLTLRSEYPQVKRVAAILENSNLQVDVTNPDGSVRGKFKEPYAFVAEPQFFEMFRFPLAAGSIRSLGEPNTVFITRKIGDKYFGDWQQAMGKTLNIYHTDMKVAGVLEDPPSNTDFPLGVVISYASLLQHVDLSDWGSIEDDNYCFVELGQDQSKEQFDKALVQFVNRHIRPVNPGYGLSLQPLREIHFDDRFGNFTGVTFSRNYILALELIGLFLIIVACVNFINLMTAQSVNRAREVGVRKVLGGQRKQLVAQFLGETGITTLLAIILSLVIVVLCLPAVNQLLDVHLSADSLLVPGYLTAVACVWLAVTVLSGLYPALVLSGFQPVHVLKNVFTTGSGKGIFLRRSLVVFQFAIAQLLIMGTLVVVSQMKYFQSADMGFDKSAVINATFPGDSVSRTRMGTLYDGLARINGVREVSFSMFTPSVTNGNWATDLRLPGNHSNNPDMIVSMLPADTGFFHLYGISLVAGRVYFPSDTVREFVVNEEVTRKLGYKKAADALGKMINVAGRTCPIVGVVKDFHQSSFRDGIGPLVMTTIKQGYQMANVKINLADATPVIAGMKALWNRNFPDEVFEYSFLDQSIAHYYDMEQKFSTLLQIFAGIAILISCLGLYGLICFMALKRRKEIGIRKVLGAPVHELVVLLSREFTILIGIAFLIASPVAWYYMHQWLQQYAYRIGIGMGFFVATIAGSLVIAWLTVSYTTVRAATTNPVKSLRTE